MQADAPPFQSHHCRRAPLSLEILSPAAGHHSSPITATNSDGKFLDRWQNGNAVSLIQHALRYAVRSIEDFLHDFPGIFDPLLFLSCPYAGNASAASSPTLIHLLFIQPPHFGLIWTRVRYPSRASFSGGHF